MFKAMVGTTQVEANNWIELHHFLISKALHFNSLDLEVTHLRSTYFKASNYPGVTIFNEEETFQSAFLAHKVDYNSIHIYTDDLEIEIQVNFAAVLPSQVMSGGAPNIALVITA